MKHLLLGFALLAFSWTAAADDVDLYKVELIVFENLDPDAIQAELWPEDPGTPPLDDAVELSVITATPPTPPALPAAAAAAPNAADAAIAPPAAQAAPTPAPAPPPPAPTWRWLDDSELSLNSQMQRLDDSHHYKTIVHVGWIQPVDSNDQGKSIHIYDGMEATRDDAAAPAQTEATVIPLAQDGAAPQTATPATPAADASSLQAVPEAASSVDQVSQAPLDIGQTAPADTAPPAAEAPHILDGTFTLRRGRFLHVDVDLGYTKTVSVEPSTPPNDTTAPADSAAPAVPQTTRYYVRMIQSRRIRNDKLNYLDHPLFGVLFQITPYQAPGTTPGTTDTSTQQ
jgi:hypothetical protein